MEEKDLQLLTQCLRSLQINHEERRASIELRVLQAVQLSQVSEETSQLG